MICNYRSLILLVIFLVLLLQSKNVSGANILGIQPFFIKSHYNAYHPMFLELAKRGHNITVISPIKEDRVPLNYRHIQVDQIRLGSVSSSNHDEPNVFEIKKRVPFLISQLFTFNMYTAYAERLLESKTLKDFTLNDNTDFDLVIAEDFRFSPFLMFAHKYRAPLITMLTLEGSHWSENYMDNPMSLHYVPHEFMPYSDKMTFVQRLENVVYTAIDLVFRKYYYQPLHDRIAQRHFGHLPAPLPKGEDLEKNVSLLFMNSHFSMNAVKSLLPNMVEVGGLHVKPPKELPSDLQKILDDSKHGVIYFSMGSSLLSKHMPKEKREAFLKVFSGLKQTILWKWEEDVLPGQSSNIITRKWFPQNDILAHPNVLIFITHGGLLSTQEAVFRGVPLIGIPVFGDQPRNIERAMTSGFAEGLEYNKLSEETIKAAINKILNNPSYQESVRKMSTLINDKPMSAMDTAVFWVEYVLRHKGAYHMKTPSSNMNWIEYFLVDVFVIIAAIALVSVLTLYLLARYITSSIISLTFKKNVSFKNKKIN